MMTIRLIPAVVIFAAAPLTGFCQDDKPAAAAAAPAEKRKLVMHRPETKGTKYEVATKVSVSRTIDFHMDDDVRPGGGGTIDASVEGTMEVTEVSPKAGNITAYTFTIKKMTLSDAEGEDNGLEPGTVVTAKMSGKEPVFTVHGGEATGELKEGLGLVMPQMSDRDEPDTTIEPPGPVAPGDKWDQDKKKLAEEVKRTRDSELDQEKSKASMSYKGPATVGGVEGDILTMTNKLVYTKVKELPEEAKLNSCEVSMDATYTMPRDVKMTLPLSAKTVMESRVRYSGKHEGKEFEGDYKTNMSLTQKVTPVK